mmetsp:Transcript_9175/g.16100  ORF Transcript_9175/g.16100 Transcript_9175/m.16100 type:complete len:249 (-) Transcript_9175:936-1682(-)
MLRRWCAVLGLGSAVLGLRHAVLPRGLCLLLGDTSVVLLLLRGPAVRLLTWVLRGHGTIAGVGRTGLPLVRRRVRLRGGCAVRGRPCLTRIRCLCPSRPSVLCWWAAICRGAGVGCWCPTIGRGAGSATRVRCGCTTIRRGTGSSTISRGAGGSTSRGGIRVHRLKRRLAHGRGGRRGGGCGHRGLCVAVSRRMAVSRRLGRRSKRVVRWGSRAQTGLITHAISQIVQGNEVSPLLCRRRAWSCGCGG